MRRSVQLGIPVTFLIIAAFLVLRGVRESAAIELFAKPGDPAARLAPQFPPVPSQHWLNSVPLRLAGVRGKVVLLDVWTFD